MITCEEIARCLCNGGKCAKCDTDCVDYKSAQRIFELIRTKHNDDITEFANKLKTCYDHPMYQKAGSHTMICKLFYNIDSILKELIND